MIPKLERGGKNTFEEILIRPISDNPVSNEPNEHDEQVIKGH